MELPPITAMTRDLGDSGDPTTHLPSADVSQPKNTNTRLKSRVSENY
ncbi:MAG TPA: hypothetical protein VFR24_08785 [Candidatus Angelobacter sp.]|nr:hypothetical protein [Candidatus Angelobacter sp.]